QALDSAAEMRALARRQESDTTQG
ncbi:MAG: hypothetical protein MOP51_1912, partial [Citricoccus sp.]|nr:hypothetical protein [Citricoccus sp. WCRC_4]